MRMYSMVGETRIAIVLTIDDSLLIVDEKVDEVKIQSAALGKHVNDANVLSWFDEKEPNNPIPNSDELRAQFFIDKANITVGGVCSGCKLGTLINRYKNILEKDGLL